MLPSFTDIYYFLEVARSTSISRAAEKLGITQPSLSAAMQRLEDKLGTLLFVRGRSGVQLTRAGRDLLDGGAELVTRWQQLKASISKREQEPGGQYVLGCHPSVAMYTLANFLPRLLQTYPSLEVKLMHDLSRKITEGVISFSIDLGIVVNPVQHPDLVIRELCHDVVSFWCARKPSTVQTLDADDSVLICDPELAQGKIYYKDCAKTKNIFLKGWCNPAVLKLLPISPPRVQVSAFSPPVSLNYASCACSTKPCQPTKTASASSIVSIINATKAARLLSRQSGTR